MNVLFIAHCRCMYGANKSLLNLILDLRERYQIQPYVVLPVEEDGEFAKVLERNNIPFFVCPYKRWIEGTQVSFKWLRVLKKACSNVFIYRTLYKQIGELDIDFVHSNSSTIQIGAWLSKKWKVPHIWHLREFGQEDYDVQIIYPKWVVNRLFSQAETVIAISEAIADKYRKKVCPKANIRTIYNGIDCDVSKHVQNEMVERNKIRFVCVGVLSEQKGQMDILKACDMLQKNGYQNYEVLLVGTGKDEYEKILKEYVLEHKLVQQVQFMGYCTNVPEILQSCDIGIVASEQEAFGRVTVEYMFSKLPVIGTNSGGTPEIIIDGEQGILYKPHDEQELAKCMMSFLDEPVKIRDYGQNAYNRAKRHFSLHANTDYIYQVYSTRMKNENE